MINRPSPRLDRAPLSVRAQLAAAWTSFMFLYIYVDYFHLHKPGVIDSIRDGLVGLDYPITPVLLTGMLASVAVSALMVTLSAVLPARAARVLNLVAAPLYIVYSVINAAGETWEWAPFYALSIGVEVLLLAFVVRAAWTWPSAPSLETPES